jgi:hypothetical protein
MHKFSLILFILLIGCSSRHEDQLLACDGMFRTQYIGLPDELKNDDTYKILAKPTEVSHKFKVGKDYLLMGGGEFGDTKLALCMTTELTYFYSSNCSIETPYNLVSDWLDVSNENRSTSIAEMVKKYGKDYFQILNTAQVDRADLSVKTVGYKLEEFSAIDVANKVNSIKNWITKNNVEYNCKLEQLKI